MSRARYPDAVAAFRRENQYHPHPLARYAERDAAYRSADFAHIEALIADPQHAPEMRGTFLLRVGIRQGNWPRILKHLWISEYSNIRPVWLILSLLAGLIWILLIGGMRSEGITLSFLPWLLAALTLGWFSTYPTLLSLFWMDKTFDLRPGSDFMSALLYFTASVGLREEFCKLLLFLPLLPRVLRRDRENDALVLGALVGLGFAVKENLGYLLQENDGGVAVSRFVSANLLHLSLTGINALALTRAWRDPQRWLSEALTVFAMTVGLHGLYNALLTAPVEGVGDLSVFSGTILIGCTLLFFRDLPGLARRRGFLSHSAVFLWGLCLLFNLELLLAASTLSMGASLIVLGQGGIGAALSALVFLHVVREPLHA
jgi:RsiW-degrading membrane proteinase PrsW (M82 family)